MHNVGNPIKRCIAEAEALLESGMKADAETIFEDTYEIAKHYGSKDDLEFAFNALLKFLHGENRLHESELVDCGDAQTA